MFATSQQTLTHEKRNIETRVLAYDIVHVRGNLTIDLSADVLNEFKTTLISTFRESSTSQTRFSLVVGNNYMDLTSKMSFSPNLRYHSHSLSQNIASSAVCSVRVTQTENGRFVELSFIDKLKYLKWYKILLETIVEVKFQSAFSLGPEGRLCTTRLERAIEDCNDLLPAENDRMLRAKQLRSAKLEVREAIRSISADPHCICRETLASLVSRCKSDNVSERSQLSPVLVFKKF